MNGRNKRYISCILVCVLLINLFVNYTPAVVIQAKDNTEPLTEATTELTTEASTEEAVTTEEVSGEATQEATEEAGSEATQETTESENFIAEEQEVQDSAATSLDVKGNVVLTEDMSVRYVFWSDSATLDLNGYKLIVSEEYNMDTGTLKLNGGLLQCEKECKVTGKASVIMNQVNDHLLVAGDLKLSGKIDFQDGIIEAKGNVTVNSLFQAQKNAVFIFSGEQKQTVKASDGSDFGHVIVQNYSTDGLYIQGGFQYQTLEDNGCNISYADIGGIRGYQLTEDEEFDGTFRLMTGTLDLNGHTLTIHGDFIQEAGTVLVNGGNLSVEGDYRLEKRKVDSNNQVTYAKSTGIITMKSDADYLYVAGNFYAQPSADIRLDKGILEVKGNLTVSKKDTSIDFYCGHLLLDGDNLQTINVPGNNRVSYLELKNTADDGIVFVEPIGVTQTVSSNQNKVTGSLYVHSYVGFSENEYHGDVIFEGTIISNTSLTIYGNVVFENTIFHINFSTVTIYGNAEGSSVSIRDGALSVYGDAKELSVTFADDNASAMIDGDYYVPEQVSFTQGTLQINGDIHGAGRIKTEKNSRIILGGDKLQTLYEADGMWLESLTLQNYSPEGVYIDAPCHISNLIQNDCRYQIEGLLGEFGWTLTEDTVYEGDLILAGGTLNLNGHRLDVTGDFVLNQGNLNLNGGTLTVYHDFRMQEIKLVDEEAAYTPTSSYMVMDKAGSKLCVKGDTYLSSKADHSSRVKDGSMEFQGDVIETGLENTDYGFVTGKNVFVYLTGTGKQTVDTGIRLDVGCLRFDNMSADGVTINGSIGVLQNVDDSGRTIHGCCTIYGGAVVIGDTFHGDILLDKRHSSVKTGYDRALYITGNLYADGAMISKNGNITVDGDCIVSTYFSVYGKLCVAGNLIWTEKRVDSTVRHLSVYGNIEVQGNLGTDSEHACYLCQFNSDSYLYIRGDAYVYGEGHSYDIEQGTMRVDGDLYIGKGVKTENEHKIVLGGSGKQYLDVATDAALGILEIQNESDEGVVAARKFSKAEFIRNGCKFRYEGIDGEFGWTLTGDETIEGDLILLDDTLDLNGHTLTVTGDFYHSAGTVKLNHGTLLISGNYYMQGYDNVDGNVAFSAGDGILDMAYADDSVQINGNLLINTNKKQGDTIKNGTIELAGDLEINSKNYEFAMQENATLLLCGKTQQSITTNSTNIKKLELVNIVCTNPSETVDTNMDLYIRGRLQMGDSRLNREIHLYQSAVLDENYYMGDVTFEEDYHLTDDCMIGGNMVVQRGKTLDLDNHVLSVQGTAFLNQTESCIGGGSICAFGDVWIGERTDTSDCTLILKGTTKQTIRSGTVGYIGELRIENTSAEGVSAQRYFRCDNLINETDSPLVFDTNDYQTGYTLTGDTVIDAERSSYFLGYGTLDLNGFTLTIKGSLVHTGGTIVFHGGTLNIEGYYCSERKEGWNEYEGYGILSMTEAADTMYTDYATFYQGLDNQYDDIKDGTIRVRHHLITKGNTVFSTYDNHSLILESRKTSTPMEGCYRLANLAFETEENVSVNADITIQKSLQGVGENISFSKVINVYRLNGIDGELNGSVMLLGDDTLEKNIKINGTLSLMNKQDVSGYRLDLNGYELDVKELRLSVKNPSYPSNKQKSGIVYVHRGRLIVSDNLTMDGTLIMQDDADYVCVGKNALFSTGVCHKELLTAGTLEIHGDLRESYKNTLQTSGTHKIILSERPDSDRSLIQTVTMAAAYAQPPLQTLELRKGISKYRFSDEIENIAREVIYADETTVPAVASLQMTEQTVNSITFVITPDAAQKEIVGYRIVRDGVTIGSTGNLTFTDNGLTDGTAYTYEVYPFDKWNREAPASPLLETETLPDTEAPSIPQGLVADHVTGREIGLTWEASTDNGDIVGYEIYRDGALITTVEKTEYTDRKLTEKKAYEYAVLAVDMAGNRSERSESLTAMPINPQIVSVSPADYATLSGQTVTLSARIKRICTKTAYTVRIEYYDTDKRTWTSVSGQEVKLSNDGVNYYFASTWWDVTGLTKDEYEVRFIVTDDAGYESVERVAYYMDHTPPMVPANLNAHSSHGVINLNFDVSASSDCVGYVIYRRAYLTEDTYEKIEYIRDPLAESYTDKTAEKNTFYEYAVCAVDDHGNESTQENSVKVKALEDDVSPSITDMNPRAGRVGHIVSIVTYAEDNRAVDQIRYYIRRETDTDWTYLGESAYEENVAVYKLNTADYEDGVYFVNAVAEDAAGNQSVDEYLRRYEFDNTGIAKPEWDTANVNATCIQLRWKDVSEDDFAYFAVEQLTPNGYTRIGKSDTVLGYMVTGLSPETEYTFRIVGYDNLDNRGEPSELYRVTTTVDDAAPVIQSIQPVSSYYRDKIPLSMKVSDNDEVAYGVFSYSLDEEQYTELAIVYASQGSRAATLSCPFDVSGLPEGDVYVKFEAYDRAGHKNYTADGMEDIVNTYRIDHTGPAAPEGLAGASGDGYIGLTWIAPKDQDIAYYRIYRADIQDGIFRIVKDKLYAANYYDTGVNVNQAYRYKIVAVDIAGNIGMESNECTASCSKDKTIPVVETVGPEDDSTFGRKAALQAAVSDNAGLSSVTFAYRQDASAWIVIGKQSVGKRCEIINQDWDLTTVAEGSYEVGVWCEDTSGNNSAVYLRTYHVDKTAPTATASVTGDDFCIHINVDMQDKEDVAYYEIYRKLVSSSEPEKNYFKKIATCTEAAYTDEDVSPFAIYEYKIQVYDAYGNFCEIKKLTAHATDTDRIAPTAILPDQMRVIAGMELVFDGGESTDNVKITEYTWQIEQSERTGRIVKHTFEQPGCYDVSLTVMDAAGNTSQTTTSVRVLPKDSTGTITVHVVDENGTPVPYAYVYMSDSSDCKLSYKADGSGQITLAASIGSYHVAAYKSGYIPKDIAVHVSRYETNTYTLQIPKGDLVEGDISIHRMTMDEMLAAGVDVTSPANLNRVTFEINLAFTEQPIPEKHVITKGIAGSGGGEGTGGSTGSSGGIGAEAGPGGGGSGKSGNTRIEPVEYDNSDVDVPIVAYIHTTQSISWLKDMYMVELGVLNAADSSYVINDASATLFLPEGISPAVTKNGQSLTIPLDSIAGQQKKYATWVVCADKPGHYEIEADFNGMLQPFNCRVSAHFKAEQRINAQSYEGLELTIMPELTAYLGEKYYIQFSVHNGTEFPIYEFTTTFGEYEEPERRQETFVINRDENTKITLDEENGRILEFGTIGECSQTPIVQGDQRLKLKEIRPGETVYGTYIAGLSLAEDAEKPEDAQLTQYVLVNQATDEMVKIIEGEDLGITIKVEPSESHIQRQVCDVTPRKSLFGDPVDVTNGAYVDNVEALSVAGDEILALLVSYDSSFAGQETIGTELGSGYYHNFETRIVAESGVVKYYVNPYSYTTFANEDSLNGIFYGELQDDSIVLSPDNSGEEVTYRALLPGLSDYRLVRHADSTYTLYAGDNSTRDFDAEGRLLAITMENGARVVCSYTEDQMIITEEKSGKRLILSYQEGRLISVADHTGRQTRFAYTGDYLSTITNPLGEHMTYVYDAQGRMTQGLNHVGLCYVENTYDAKNRVIRQLDSAGRVTTYSYEDMADGIRTTCTDSDGNQTVTESDSFGNILCVTSPTGEVVSYTYDDYGNMLSSASSCGDSYQYAYDENNRMVSCTHAGNTIALSYDAEGRMTEASQSPGGAATSIQYDGAGRIAVVENGMRRVSYTYTEQGKTETITEDGRGTTKFAYDAGGCDLISMTDALGNMTGNTYDERGNLVSVTDACGAVTCYAYDACNRIISVTHPDGGVWHYTYDFYGNVSSFQDALGNTTSYTYDTAGNLTSVTYPDGKKESYAYDGAGNVTEKTGRDGLVTGYTYDSYGHVTEIRYPDGTKESYLYDSFGRLTAGTDRYGNQTTYSYDTLGRLAGFETADGMRYEQSFAGNTANITGITRGTDVLSVSAYDSMGNLTEKTDAAGNRTGYSYDAWSQVTEEVDAAGNRTGYSYDICGNCTAITYADGVSMQLSYDGCNRLVGISTGDGTVSVGYEYDSMGNVKAYTDELGNVTRYVYDKNSRLTEVYDAEDHKTASYTYDVAGRIATEEDAAGIISTYTYNRFDQPERIVMRAGSGEEKTYSYTYDDFGRLLSVTAPDGTTAGQTYDTYGNVTGVISPMGGVTGYAYDNLGRITQETLSIGTKTMYTYNMDGLLSKYANGRGQETEYAYDANGRLSVLSDAEGDIAYTYDANGNILTETETDKNGETYTITRTYDSRNRVTSVTDYKGNTVSYGYDELGNRISLTYAGGEIVRYTYLANGLMESMVDGEGYRTSYSYDRLGNVTAIQKPDGSVESYTYDACSRMTGHTVEAAGETVEDAYVYDAWGNIVSVTHMGAEADGIRTPETLVMTYDSANRMVSINGEEVRYDDDGNMTYGPVDGVMTELVYDSRNRLIQAGDTRYEYDADNIRTAVITPEYREDYTVDREGAISRILDIRRTYTDGREETERYYYGTGLVYEKRQIDNQDTKDLYIYHFNHLGSTMMLTDGEGNIVDTYAYGTYGELLPVTGQEDTNHDNIIRFLYNGEYGVCTDDNGLYYMRARYYNPEIRRFINQDVLTGSIEDAASLNRYSYVEGNPVSYTDPFGLSPFMTVTHIGLGIGGIFCPILNIVDAGLYFLEGDFYHGTESLVFAFVGGKGAQYLAKAGKYFGVGAKVTEGISKACTIGAPLLAAHDTGSSVAFMIDKYGVNGEEISAYTALEAANVVMSGMQTGAYTRNLFGNSYVMNAGSNYENAVAASGQNGSGSNSEELIHIYRGTNRYSEIATFEETGQLMSDATRKIYRETGSIKSAYEKSNEIHDNWIKIWGNENDYVQAHSVFGTELSDAFGLNRTFVSVTTDIDIAYRFAGKQGMIYEAYIPKSKLIKQTLSGAGESEYLIKFGSGGFKCH